MSSKTKPKGKDLDAFRSVHDKSFLVPKRITEGLAQLGDSWEYEGEFIKRCQVSQSDFATFRTSFLEYSVETPSVSGNRGKRVWAGTKKYATLLRDKVK